MGGKLARASTLPVEVRPFYGEAGNDGQAAGGRLGCGGLGVDHLLDGSRGKPADEDF